MEPVQRGQVFGRRTTIILNGDIAMNAMGRKHWAPPEGRVRSQSSSTGRAPIFHEADCMLNAGDGDAHVQFIVFFAGRDPALPYRSMVPARRAIAGSTRWRFSRRCSSEAVPIVVQHTCGSVRATGVTLLSTTAYSES
jgi:hypothetical protein